MCVWKYIFPFAFVCMIQSILQQYTRNAIFCEYDQYVNLNCSTDFIISIQEVVVVNPSHPCKNESNRQNCLKAATNNFKDNCNGRSQCNYHTAILFTNKCNKTPRYIEIKIECEKLMRRKICGDKLADIQCSSGEGIDFKDVVTTKYDNRCTRCTTPGLKTEVEGLCDDKQKCMTPFDDSPCLFDPRFADVTYLCYKQKTLTTQSSTSSGLTVGITIGILLAVCTVISVLYYLRKRYGCRRIQASKTLFRHYRDDYIGNQCVAFPECHRSGNIMKSNESKNVGSVPCLRLHSITTDMFGDIKSCDLSKSYSVVSARKEDVYASTTDDIYDHSNENRHVDVDSNVYSHTVDNVYDSSSNQCRNNNQDDEYDHFYGKNTEACEGYYNVTLKS